MEGITNVVIFITAGTDGVAKKIANRLPGVSPRKIIFK